jgi:hypothetical protein
MLYLSSITFHAPRLKAYSINTGFLTKALIPEVSGLQATGSSLCKQVKDAHSTGQDFVSGW